MTKPYRWLAQYYDELFSAARAPIDLQRERILGALMPCVQSACDLACGCGTTALAFAERGIRTYALDLSPDMCRLARKKARAAGVLVRVLQADMRSFHLPEPVDLITCECDALNHIPRRSDLPRVARAVSRGLRPGGHFYFDVNNALGFEAYWTGAVWLETLNACAVMRNGHDAQSTKAWSDVEWFIRDGRRWRRHSERVEEVCWTEAEIRSALRADGFRRVRAWDGRAFFPDNPLMKPGCRTVYLATKKDNRTC
jgi:SAM-dependent methyltransferase